MALRVGDACEVAGAAAEGFPHCWFRGTVEAVVPGTVDGPPMLQASRGWAAAGRRLRTQEAPVIPEPV